MDDFAVEMTNMPVDGFFNHSEAALKAYIWQHIETVLYDQYKTNCGGERYNEWHMMQNLHIVDVNFGKRTEKEVGVLLKLSQLRKQSQAQHFKL